MPDDQTSPPPSSKPAALIFTTSPLPLGEIASAQTAFLLWRLKIQTRPAGEIPTFQWFQKQNFAAKDIVPETIPVQDSINPYIRSIGTELRNWLEYHSQRIFFDSPPHGVIWKSFDRLKFQHDGSLDYVATAKNLINCNRLSRNDKYRLACCYCLEENIRLMWPTFYINPHAGLFNNISKRMIKYWNELMLHELRSKGEPPKDASALAKRKLSIVHKHPRNWTAVEYFFSKLHPDEKLNHMLDLVDLNISYVVRLLPKLPEDQIRTVMEKKGLVIWFRFSREPKYADHAFQTWYYIKDSICQDSFYGMIKLTIEDQLVKLQTKTNNRVVIGLLYKIWISADDRLKSCVVSNYISSILQVSFESNEDMFKVINQDSRFFLTILSHTSVELRNRLWNKYSSLMIVSIPPKYLHRLFQSCIGDDDKIAEYKRIIFSAPLIYPKIKNHCVDWIREGYYGYFDDFSDIFSLDKESSTKFKQEVLVSGDNLPCVIFQLFNKDKWHIFRTFIDTSFVDPEISKGFKKCFAYSYRLRSDLSLALNQGRLQEVVYFLQLFLEHDDLSELKRDIFDECHRNLAAARIYNFTAPNWQAFFYWCLGSECEIAEFKISARINEIFEKFVEKYARFNSKYDTNRDECDLIKFNNFLLWYFDSKELVGRYKLNKVANYGGIKTFKKVFQVDDDHLVDKLIDWFFEGDKQMIENWNDPSIANLPPFMANTVKMLRKKWAYCGKL